MLDLPRINPYYVREVQRQCVRLGLDPGVPNGKWSDETASAVKTAHKLHARVYDFENLLLEPTNAVTIAGCLKRIPG